MKPRALALLGWIVWRFASRGEMTNRGYTVLGWLVWQGGGRGLKRKLRQNRGKLGAAAVVAGVLVAGVVAAARTAAGDDD